MMIAIAVFALGFCVCTSLLTVAGALVLMHKTRSAPDTEKNEEVRR